MDTNELKIVPEYEGPLVNVRVQTVNLYRFQKFYPKAYMTSKNSNCKLVCAFCNKKIEGDVMMAKTLDHGIVDLDKEHWAILSNKLEEAKEDSK